MPARHLFPSPERVERQPKPMWSTTASAEFDATAAANDDAGSLGFHAAACKLAANGGRRRVIDTLTMIGGILRPKFITVVVALTLLATAAAWLFG